MVSIVFLWNVTYDRTVGLVESDMFGQFCFTSNFISEDDFPHELRVYRCNSLLAESAMVYCDHTLSPESSKTETEATSGI